VIDLVCNLVICAAVVAGVVLSPAVYPCGRGWCTGNGGHLENASCTTAVGGRAVTVWGC
jgi:hypothetical protein